MIRQIIKSSIHGLIAGLIYGVVGVAAVLAALPR